MSKNTQLVNIDGQQVQAIVIESEGKVYSAVTPQDSHKVSVDQLFTKKSKQA